MLPAQSRSQIQGLIKEGHVLVDGRAARANQAVKAGQQIVFEVPEPVEAEPQPEALPLTIVYQDPDVIVVDKPAGMVVHPAAGHESGTLVNAVLAHAGDELTGIGGVERPGIVHRLDKDTSGLMVVAKSERAYHSLQAQIQARTAERRYVAVVRGTPRFERASVDAPIGRHPTDHPQAPIW